ncbi:MAG: type IV pilus modification PilV family protein [Rubripirellula sp.]
MIQLLRNVDSKKPARIDSENHCSGKPSARFAFSLLEVILATAILLASSMTLLRLLSVGSKHQIRAERLANAQIICNSLIDEWLINPKIRRETMGEPIPGVPQWLYNADIETTEFPGLSRVHIAVFSEEPSTAGESAKTTERRPTFELVRWMRIPNPVTAEP